MSIPDSEITAFYDKLKKVLPIKNGNNDGLLKFLNRGASYVPQPPHSDAHGSPIYAETLNKMSEYLLRFQTELGYWYLGGPCMNMPKYSSITVYTDNGLTVAENSVSTSINQAKTYFQNPFSLTDGIYGSGDTIPLSTGQLATRSSYQGLESTICSTLNNRFLGWDAENVSLVIPQATPSVPIQEWYNTFFNGLNSWADGNLELWRIGGLDVKTKYKIRTGTYTVNTTETWTASLVVIKSVYDSGSNTYLSANSPVVYQTGGTVSASFTAGSVVDESNWKTYDDNSPYTYSSPVNSVSDLYRGNDVLRAYNLDIPKESSCSFNTYQEGKDRLVQETKLCYSSMGYTPCLNYFITGLSSASECMQWKRRCWIPETTSWPSSASGIYICYELATGGYSAINPTHYFNEIQGQTLTDQMTDTFTVYQKAVSMKFINPYNYPIEVQIRVQKLLGGEERFNLYTNKVEFDSSAKDSLDWTAGVQATYATPEARSLSGGSEGVGLVSPLLYDSNSILTGTCERQREFYQNNSYYGQTLETVSSGWTGFLDITGGSESVKASYVNTLRNSAYVVDEIDIELEPGEEYILEKDYAPLWTGSVNYNPFQTFMSYNYEMFPGNERVNIPLERFENSVTYEVTYCWRPKPEEEPEEESE